MIFGRDHVGYTNLVPKYCIWIIMEKPQNLQKTISGMEYAYLC